MARVNRPRLAASNARLDPRKRDLAQIHQGKAALGWSDDDYRWHLQQLTGKASAADMTAPERRRVLDHMATLGWAPKRVFKPFTQAEKIRWFWKKLADAGALRNSSEQALRAFMGKVAGMEVSDPKFLPVAEASKVIEALKAMLRRVEQARKGPIHP